MTRGPFQPRRQVAHVERLVEDGEGAQRAGRLDQVGSAVGGHQDHRRIQQERQYMAARTCK